LTRKLEQSLSQISHEVDLLAEQVKLQDKAIHQTVQSVAKEYMLQRIQLYEDDTTGQKGAYQRQDFGEELVEDESEMGGDMH
jgi:hypothetical protein